MENRRTPFTQLGPLLPIIKESIRLNGIYSHIYIDTSRGGHFRKCYSRDNHKGCWRPAPKDKNKGKGGWLKANQISENLHQLLLTLENVLWLEQKFNQIGDFPSEKEFIRRWRNLPFENVVTNTTEENIVIPPPSSPVTQITLNQAQRRPFSPFRTEEHPSKNNNPNSVILQLKINEGDIINQITMKSPCIVDVSLDAEDYSLVCMYKYKNNKIAIKLFDEQLEKRGGIIFKNSGRPREMKVNENYYFTTKSGI